MKPISPKLAKLNASRRTALVAALNGKSEANSSSLSRSYALSLAEVRRIMLNMGVTDND